MPQMLFDDLQTKRKVGITLGGTFCGFYAKRQMIPKLCFG